MRIGISGPSGMGKTTLAKYLSSFMGWEHISGSSKTLWAQHGIQNHQHLLSMMAKKPEWGLEFHNQLLANRKLEVSGRSHFVTDRTPLDNLVYFLIQGASFFTQEQTAQVVEECVYNCSQLFDIIFVIATPDMELEKDGMRIDNTYYQDMTLGVFNHTIRKYLRGFLPGETFEKNKLQVRILTTDDWYHRRNQVMQGIHEYHLTQINGSKIEDFQ